MAVASSLSTTFSLLHPSLSDPRKPSFLSFIARGVTSLSLRNSRRVFIQAKVYEQEGEESEIEEEDETSSELYESSEEVDELASEEEGGEEIVSEFSVEISNEPTEVVAEKPPKKSASSANGSQQRIILKNKYGEKIVGIFQESNSDEIVILCHGFNSSKKSKTISHLSETLNFEGISTFRFDFSGNGESEGNFEYGNYFKEVEDLRFVIQYFNGINRKINCIIGHSKGGDVVILYACLYKDVYNVVNICGRFDLNKGIKERLGEDYLENIKKNGFIDVRDKLGKFMYRVNESSLMDRLGINMKEKCVLIDPKIRVLTVHGSKDDVVPVNDAIEFSKVIKNHKLEIIDGADHRFMRNLFELSKIVYEFVKLGFSE